MKKCIFLFSIIFSLSSVAQNTHSNSTNETAKQHYGETAKLNITLILGLSGSVNNDSLILLKSRLSSIGINYKNYCPGQKCLVVWAPAELFPNKEIMAAKSIAVSNGLVLGTKEYDVNEFLLQCDLSNEEATKLKTQLSEK